MLYKRSDFLAFMKHVVHRAQKKNIRRLFSPCSYSKHGLKFSNLNKATKSPKFLCCAVNPLPNLVFPVTNDQPF